VYAVVAWISLAVIIVTSAYGIGEALFGAKEPWGQYFLVYWPFPPYVAQPVTYFSVAWISLFYSGMRLWEERMAKWPRWILSFLQLIGFIVAFSAGYEVMYNFMVWGSTYAIACGGVQGACDPNTLSTLYPYTFSWNLAFATNAYAALFVVSGYSVYYLRKVAGSGMA
jgi:hypothetical protein